MNWDRAFNVAGITLMAWLAFAFYISIRDESALRDAIDIRIGVQQIDKAR